jgi:hypothetical protein
MNALSCDEIVRAHVQDLGARFACYEDGERLWVVSPYTYPDSDLLEITVRALDGNRVRLSDLGETLRHLAAGGFDPRGTPKGEYLLSEILKQHHITLDRGMLVRDAPAERLGSAMHDILTACLAVAHLSYLSRAARPATFPEEVAQLLAQHHAAFGLGYEEQGLSGKKYKIGIHVRGQLRDGLIQPLAPASISSRTQVVNANFRLWSDLDNHRWKATLLDDRLTAWPDPDVTLLRKVSKVYRWTLDIDEFVQDLEAVQPASNAIWADAPSPDPHP